MKRCDPCGLDFEGRVLFCRICGSLLVAPAGTVAYDDLPPTAKVRTCSRCDAPARFAWRFCSRCGADLVADEAEAAAGVEHMDGTLPGHTAPALAVPTSALASGTGACPFCGTGMTPEHRFCERCGFEVIRCASCDAIVPAADAQFCDECGVTLDDPAQRATLREPIPSPVAPVRRVEAPRAAAPVAPVQNEHVPKPVPVPPAFLASYETPTPRAGRRGAIVRAIAVLALLGVAGTVALVVWRYRTVSSAKTPSVPARAETNPAIAPRPSPKPVEVPPGMVLVPGGTFSMGSNTGDAFERPSHTVVMAPFFMDITEVTCEAYARFLEATGRKAPSGWAGSAPPKGTERNPVTGVSWDDATAYATWAGKRLPTEAEWEYAARGTDGRKYPWGAQWLPNRANASETAAGRMVDVERFPEGRSPFGLHDMSGNAWEWTSTALEAYPGGRLPKAYKNDEKVIRGGCWRSDAIQSSSTYRYGWPARTAKDYRDTGFRCAMSAPQPKPEEPT
jgi:formylglycine-generating enzyme required for sulfatase activity